MSAQHTPGRLFVTESQEHWGRVNCHITAEVDQAMIGSIWVNSTEQNRADARRLVACWNACDGIDTYALDLMTGDLSIKNQITATGKAHTKPTHRAVEYRRQRDELLAALKALMSQTNSGELAEALDKARAAIAKATGVTA